MAEPEQRMDKSRETSDRRLEGPSFRRMRNPGGFLNFSETNLDAGFHRHDEIPTRMMARGMNGF